MIKLHDQNSNGMLFRMGTSVVLVLILVLCWCHSIYLLYYHITEEDLFTGLAVSPVGIVKVGQNQATVGIVLYVVLDRVLHLFFILINNIITIKHVLCC